MKLLEPAQKPNASYTPYDARAPLVAEKLKKEIASLTDIFEVEHIGSTAVPGAAGKGIIDLLALYPEGALEETKRFLLSVGFRRQDSEWAYPWPDDRPMYLGNYIFDGDTFLVYIHVVINDSDEVRRFRVFRDRLKASPGLLKEYCAVKQSIIMDGVRNTDVYVKRKMQIIRKILGSDYELKK